MALAYRVLRDHHRTMMWKEVLAAGPAVFDACISALMVFAMIRKGARRTGYIAYDAVMPHELAPGAV